jgi:hypothetical protein
MRVTAPVWVVVGASLTLLSQPGRVVPFANAATSAGDRAIFEPLRPTRVFDTRTTAGAPALAGGAVRTVVMTGAGGVPADATAVVVNVTVVKPTRTAYVVAWPAGLARPTVYTVAVVAAQTASNMSTVKLGTGGAISLYLSAGSAHMVLEVSGYFRAHDHDDRYLTKEQAQARTAAGAFTCGAGEFLRSVAADGAPVCATPPSPPAIPEPTSPFLGTGAGSFTVAAGQTAGQSGDFYRQDLTIGDGGTFLVNGYRVVLSGTLTLGEGATIQRNGNPGTLSAAGAALAPGSLGGGGAGACSVPSAQVTNSVGGAGSNMGSTGTIAVRPPMTVGGSGVVQWFPSLATGRTFDGAQLNGGAGGGGTACPSTTNGGGGSGGGVVVVIARHIVLTGSQAFVTADGGSSTAAGGGGGGVVLVASFDPQPAGLVLRALGGTSGGSTSWKGTNGFTRYYRL